MAPPEGPSAREDSRKGMMLGRWGHMAEGRPTMRALKEARRHLVTRGAEGLEAAAVLRAARVAR
jgi:hypothetical protein